MSSQEKRKAIVAEARSWIGTPFLHQAAIKGVGVDCFQFLKACYEPVTGKKIEVPHYGPQWHLHTTGEHYLWVLRRHGRELLAEHAEEIVVPQPADVCILQHGRVFDHGAIVLEWPRVIHAFDRCVHEADALTAPVFLGWPLKFFDLVGA